MDYVIFNIVTVDVTIIPFCKVKKKKIIVKTIIARGVSEKYKVV